MEKKGASYLASHIKSSSLLVLFYTPKHFSHLSQRALIPHFTAIKPVLLELGFIIPGLASIPLGLSWASSIRELEHGDLTWVYAYIVVGEDEVGF